MSSITLYSVFGYDLTSMVLRVSIPKLHSKTNILLLGPSTRQPVAWHPPHDAVSASASALVLIVSSFAIFVPICLHSGAVFLFVTELEPNRRKRMSIRCKREMNMKKKSTAADLKSKWHYASFGPFSGSWRGVWDAEWYWQPFIGCCARRGGFFGGGCVVYL